MTAMTRETRIIYYGNFYLFVFKGVITEYKKSFSLRNQ